MVFLVMRQFDLLKLDILQQELQIMNKNEQVLGDSLQTHQDGMNVGLNSFGSPSLLSSSRLEKCDASTITDQMICNCACDSIPKLKQKAHKSFMQVMYIEKYFSQIQNLYKEEIQELKNFYEESLKTKDKKFKIKEDLLNEKCKQLECQIQKVKDYYKKQRPHEIEGVIDQPFNLENIENIQNIVVQTLPDESSQSIYNIRQFIQTTNLKDSSKRLERDLSLLLGDIKKLRQKDGVQIDEQHQQVSKLLEIQHNLEQQISKIFVFIDNMIQNTIQAHQKYNQLVLVTNQAENRYSKLYGLHQAGLKQAKFMSEHIKKISQDRIQSQRKNNELERTIKNQEQNIKFLKKLVAQKQLKINDQPPKKDIDCLTTYNPREHEVDRVITNSLLSSKIERKNHHGMLAKSLQGNPDKILPRSLNFKKKISQADRGQNK